jgi:putative tricarboxylic transport membrane protein
VDLFSNLTLGLAVALSMKSIALCAIGCFVGTLVGVLPGVGPVPTIAMLLPITFGLDPAGSLIMLAGIFYGAQYGCSSSAILLRIPGEASAIVTVIDGHALARQGRAGVALGVAALSSFVAGTIATFVIAIMGRPLAALGLLFGPSELFAAMAFGLVLAVVLSQGSLFKGVAMVVLGLVLATVGRDIETGEERFTFGFGELDDGIEFSVLAVGLFGIAEILRNLEGLGRGEIASRHIGRLWPTAGELRRVALPTLRGTVLGCLLGILPGNGVVLAPFASYAAEKRLARDRVSFGQGALEGVAAPEASNNAAAQTSFLPLLTLGIPGNAVMALMIGAMTIHGIVPGPAIMTKQPELFWGVIVSMWVGNLLLVVINLPLLGIWVQLMRVPYRILFPIILLFCCIGLYTINNAAFDVAVCGLVGLVGYSLVKLGFEMTPLMLGYVLGRLMEESFRRAVLSADGNVWFFLDKPIAAAFLAAAMGLLLVSVLAPMRRLIDPLSGGSKQSCQG